MKQMFAPLIVAVLLAAAPVFAVSNAHFVGTPTFTISGSTVTTSGKVAGLGNVLQIHVVLSGTAECINGGNKHPQAVNKGSFNAEGDFPVQNGKALFSLILEATFQPPCDPPMSVSWSELQVTVTAGDGTFISFP